MVQTMAFQVKSIIIIINLFTVDKKILHSFRQSQLKYLATVFLKSYSIVMKFSKLFEAWTAKSYNQKH